MEQYTQVVTSQYSWEMISWCEKNIEGYSRLVQPNFYFDAGYSWYAHRGLDRTRMVFNFARPEDAILFTLRWT